MKRGALVTVVLCLVFLSTGSVQAAPSAVPSWHGLSGLLAASSHTRSLAPSKLDPLSRPNGTAKSVSAQSGGSMRLAPSAFSPASLQVDGPEDNAHADTTPLGQDHSTSYENLQRIDSTGYYQVATWQPAGQADTATFIYLGSTFPNASQAQNAWQDGVTHTQQVYNSQYTPCTSQFGVTCAFEGYTAQVNGANVNIVDTFLQYNQCLAETEMQFTSNLYNTSSNQLSQTDANIDTAATTLIQSVCGNGPPPQPSPQPQPTLAPPPTVQPPPRPTAQPAVTPTNFQIVAVRVEKNGAKPDWDLKNAPVRQVKVGTPVYLSVYWHLTSAPANPQPQFHFVLRDGGRVVKDESGTIKSTYPSGYTFRSFIPYTLKQAGGYALTIDVNLNGLSDEGTTTFKVLRNVVVTPPPPQIRRISFSLLAVQTLNGSGKPQTTFRPGETVKIKARFTIANLSGTTPVEVDRVTQFKVNGQWQSVGFNSQQFPAAGGANFATSSFQLSSTVQPGDMRFIVSVTIAGKTQRRITLIHVA